MDPLHYLGLYQYTNPLSKKKYQYANPKSPHFCPQFNKHSLFKLPNNKTPKPSSLRCHLKPESNSKSNTKSYRPSANTRTEVRWNRYKVAVDSDEGHRRRGDTMMEIRKNHREESLHKKRCEGLQSQQIPSSLHSTVIEKKINSYHLSVIFFFHYFF